MFTQNQLNIDHCYAMYTVVVDLLSNAIKHYPVAKLWPFLYIQDGRKQPSWILSNRKQRHSIRRHRKPQPRTKHGVDRMHASFARYSLLNYTVTLKLGFGVTQGYRKRHCLLEHIRLYIHLPQYICFCLLPFSRHSRILVENRYRLVFGAPVRGEAVRVTQRPLVALNQNDGPIRQ